MGEGEVMVVLTRRGGRERGDEGIGGGKGIYIGRRVREVNVIIINENNWRDIRKRKRSE